MRGRPIAGHPRESPGGGGAGSRVSSACHLFPATARGGPVGSDKALAGIPIHARDRGQILVDRSQIVVGHVAIHRPGHYLEHGGQVIRIEAVAYDFLESGEAIGDSSTGIRGEIPRAKRAKISSASQVAGAVDLLRLPEERIATRFVIGPKVGR